MLTAEESQIALPSAFDAGQEHGGDLLHNAWRVSSASCATVASKLRHLGQQEGASTGIMHHCLSQCRHQGGFARERDWSVNCVPAKSLLA